ncbi:SMI1/KNR4 family protein [Kitasatospora camelliae]|uniref:SMI1/KNR4 family protein n=1 Tax=Kitasatospora camelliae TaxID=3156397 RepID=A0AAU8K4R9_9ACTN
MITGDILLARLHALAARVPFDPGIRPGGRIPAPGGRPAPGPVADLVGRVGGFAVPPVEFLLTGHPRQESDHGLPDRRWVVSDDGGGGLTWVDITTDGSWGQVLMQYREGGLYLQADSLGSWLDRLLTTAEQLADAYGPDEDPSSYADDFWDALHPDGPDLPLHPAPALRAPATDPVLAELAHRVPDSALLADLRAATPGSRARFDRHLRWYRLVRATDGPVFAAVPRDPA